MSWEGWAVIATIVLFLVDAARRTVTKAKDEGISQAKDEQQSKDIDGIGRKVDHIRDELKKDIASLEAKHREDIAKIEGRHDDLRAKVNEIAETTAANNALLQQLVAQHTGVDH